MNKNNSRFIKTREQILLEMKKEILGPGSEDVIGVDIEKEIITDHPAQRYSVGILFPQNCKVDEAKGNQYDGADVDSESEEIEAEIKQVEAETAEKKKENMMSKEILVFSEADDKLEELDQEISMANQYLPSAAGMTFFIKQGCTQLKVRIKYAKYRQALVSDCRVKYEGRDFFTDTSFDEFIMKDREFLVLKRQLSLSKARELINKENFQQDREISWYIYKLANQSPDDQSKHFSYVREPVMLYDTAPINLNIPYQNIPLNDDAALAVTTRNYGNSMKSVTLMLMNRNNGNKIYKKIIFQPEICILSEENPNMIFIDLFEAGINSSAVKLDSEDMSLDLLYKNKKAYAAGHGVGTVQDVCSETGQLKRIYTDYLPSYEVAKLDFDIKELNEISDELLSMKNLSDISPYDKEHKITLLNKFTDVYGRWIDALKIKAQGLDERYQTTAEKHISDCVYAQKRMREGIDLIMKDESVYTAFSLMNRALLMQRAHSEMPDRFPDEDELENIDYAEVKAKWRPFQLAYILMCLSSIAENKSSHRDIVDLLWVPTGGGKTEAYLGLTAFTIFLRRLKNADAGCGTTAIMRYTLRLLAAQQFIRASIMICACEVIRREKKYRKMLGEEEISIGLWIGRGQTPNTNDTAEKELNALQKHPKNGYELNYLKSEHNQFQVLKCPWCGTKLEKEYVDKKIKGQWGYRMSKKSRGFELFCPEQECAFETRLPIQVVDEEVYKNPPTLLFATVDKFAMITWKEDVSRLFALDDKNNNLSPELIIQDELHLISGPLGTMVGLYETAVDAMCSFKGIKPKIIASTATIRRAEEQVKNLYNRKVSQFPPPGLSAEDSFFVKEADISNEPGRLYVGIMPSGKTQVTVEVRLMSALLQKISMLDVSEDIKDKYWTLVGYFNSIRELGKCSTLLNDDITDNMTRLVRRLYAEVFARKLYNQKELTSRLTSIQINETLKELEKKLTLENYNYPIDVLSASNMISVGVDVSRLNCMVVVGQPKLTSEYIQATSRVGRSYPGIVFTLYNSSKTRDRSHFEQFYKYHQSFYKYVEPTSVTPFSEPARERGLHAVFISMIRHILGLQSEESASKFESDSPKINDIVDYIAARAVDISEENKLALEEELKSELNEIIDFWKGRIDSLSVLNEPLLYGKEKAEHKLLIPYDKEPLSNEKPTLQSMRNVDKSCKVKIVQLGDE